MIEVEYAVNGRASCRACSELILKDTLRVGRTAWSDEGGFSTHWHHAACFPPFSGSTATIAKDLQGYDRLCPEDQATLRGKLRENNPVEAGDDGKKMKKKGTNKTKKQSNESTTVTTSSNDKKLTQEQSMAKKRKRCSSTPVF